MDGQPEKLAALKSKNIEMETNINLIGKKVKDTYNNEVVFITETTGEKGYFKFENERYSTYGYIGDRFVIID